MKTLESSIVRLMLAIVTVAIGCVTMRTQADFWFGSLSTFVAGWLFLALIEVIAGPGRGRAFWCGFLVVTLASLIISFGPWSDRLIRGRSQRVEQDWAELQPLSRGIWRLNPLLRPGPRSRLSTFDKVGRPQTVITLVTPSWKDEESGLGARFIDLLKLDGRGLSSMPAGVVFVADEDSYDIAQDAGHLLASLAFGSLAGLILAVLSGRRILTPEHSQSL